MRSVLICIIFLSLSVCGCSPVRSGSKVVRKEPSKAETGKLDSAKAEKEAGKRKNFRKPATATAKAKDTATTRTKDIARPKVNYNKPRFVDTTEIQLEPVLPDQDTDIITQFDNAVKEFNAENFKDACSQFLSFSTTLEKGDSLQLEALFYVSECEITNNNFKKAEGILKNLMSSKNLPQTLTERVIIRLGQLYCVMNKKKDAARQFSRLKKEYPESIYIPLATCDAIKR